MFTPLFMMRTGLKLFSTIFGSCGIFFFCESFTSAVAAAYAVLFLVVATVITAASDGARRR